VRDSCLSPGLVAKCLPFLFRPVEFNLINFVEIYCWYAKRYELKKFTGYMKTILKNYKNQTQELKKIDDIEPWITRSKRSQGGICCITC
jgi:hypothetical protein